VLLDVTDVEWYCLNVGGRESAAMSVHRTSMLNRVGLSCDDEIESDVYGIGQHIWG
jgi:hypothetical protein